MINTNLASLFPGKIELPSLDKFPSNKQTSIKEDEGTYGN